MKQKKQSKKPSKAVRAWAIRRDHYEGSPEWVVVTDVTKTQMEESIAGDAFSTIVRVEIREV